MKKKLFVLAFLIFSLSFHVDAQTLDSRYHEVGSFDISAYTAGEESTGKKPGDPGYGVTASGYYVTPNRTIATDWDVLPEGSIIKIEGLEHLYVVEDTGSAIKGNRIDLYMPSLQEALGWGRQTRTVYVLDSPSPMDYIVPSAGKAPSGSNENGGGSSMDFQSIIAEAILYLLKPFIAFLSENTYSITELVFSLNKEGTGSNGLVYGLFTVGEVKDIIEVGMNGVRIACQMFLALGIFHFGYLMTRSGSNERIRQELFTNTFAFFFSAFLISNIETFYDMMFQFNRAIVSSFANLVGTVNFQDHDGGDELVTLVLMLMFVGLSLWANFYYLLRKFIIILLMVTGPIFITVSVFPQFRQVTGTWAKELFSNIITQAIHAILLWMFLIMAASNSADWLLQIVFLATFIPVSEMLKSLIGASSTSGALAGAQSIAAIGAAAQVAGGVKNFVGGAGSDVMGKLKSQFMGNSGGSHAGNGEGANYTPPGIGGNSTAGGHGGMQGGQPISPLTPTPLTPNRRANRMLGVGNTLGRAASSIGAVAGGIMGAPLGSFGMMAGASLGANVGSAVGTVGGRTLGAGLNVVGSEAKSVLQGASHGISQAQGQSIASKVGSMAKGAYQSSSLSRGINTVQKGGQGLSAAYQAGGIRALGQHATDSVANNAESINRLLRDGSAMTMGALRGAGAYNSTYQILQQDSPLNSAINEQTVSYSQLRNMAQNGDVRNLREIQTNEGTFIVGRRLLDNGKYSNYDRLSKVGEANPLLKDGESIVRNMDYNPMESKLSFTTQPQIRGANGVTMDAQNLYQSINPQTLFKSPHTNLVRKRAERNHHQRWLNQKGVGGGS